MITKPQNALMLNIFIISFQFNEKYPQLFSFTWDYLYIFFDIGRDF